MLMSRPGLRHGHIRASSNPHSRILKLWLYDQMIPQDRSMFRVCEECELALLLN